MGRKNKAANVDDPQDEGGANEDTQQDTKTESKEEEKNGAQKEEGKFQSIYYWLLKWRVER